MIPKVNNPETMSDYSCRTLPIGFFFFFLLSAGKLASLSRNFFDYFSKFTHDFQPRAMLPQDDQAWLYLELHSNHMDRKQGVVAGGN